MDHGSAEHMSIAMPRIWCIKPVPSLARSGTQKLRSKRSYRQPRYPEASKSLSGTKTNQGGKRHRHGAPHLSEVAGQLLV